MVLNHDQYQDGVDDKNTFEENYRGMVIKVGSDGGCQQQGRYQWLLVNKVSMVDHRFLVLKMLNCFVFIIEYPAGYQQQEGDGDKVCSCLVPEKIISLYLV